MTKTFTLAEPFLLESGKTITNLTLAYSVFGELNSSKNNVVWIFHALTANSNPVEWWPGLVGENKLFDPKKYCIVCVNMPGSCYGSTQPLSVNKQTGDAFYHNFPWFTTRDMVRAYQHLQHFLGIKQIYVGIGGSMGGQQLLQWAAEDTALFQHIIPIATNAIHSAWGIAFNQSQRMAIENDSTWQQKKDLAGINGLKVARSIALLSYRNHDTYVKLQTGVTEKTIDEAVDNQQYKAETYQQYQGEKLAKRFNAFSYYFLTKGMDSHNLARGRNASIEAVLASIQAKTLVIGIDSDILFPPNEQAFIAKHIPNAQFNTIQSLYGHDGFLLEFEVIENIIKQFLYI
ncbi:MAG: homoserine O-acetyltransferase family protein [Chitinophagaceae bacterium]